MSSTPTNLSNLSNFSPKSFWSKPEGTPGKFIMAIAALAGGWGLYLALPFLITLVSNLIYLGALVLALVLGVLIVMNPTVQNLVKNIFQSICRGIATVYTTIDPIGILKNNLDDMRKAKAELDQTIQRFAGSDNKLVTKIAQKTALVQQLGAQVAAAERKANSTADPDEKERITLAKETMEQKAGLEMTGIQQLTQLEAQTHDMLDKFRHWSRVSDAKIDRTAAKVDFYSEQRDAILDAQKVLSVGQRILRGNPEELKLVDGAIDFLSDEAARTVGEIQEFNRFSEKELTNIDIENTANADIARKKFAEFGIKLDNDAAKPSAVQQLEAAMSGASAPISMPNGSVMGKTAAVGSQSGTTDYNDLFNK